MDNKRLLFDIRYAGPVFFTVPVLADLSIEEDLPVAGFNEPQNDIEQGGLSFPGIALYPEEVSCLQVEVTVFQYFCRTKLKTDIPACQ